MIIPAFDLINGQAVRLYQGNYSRQKNYDINLYDSLQLYKLDGAEMIHLVDLDGAKDKKNRQIELLKRILSYQIIPIQIGGGVRTTEDISFFLNLGAKRVVIGSSIIENKEEVKKWLNIYGSDSIVLALDVNVSADFKKEICINGWQIKTKINLEEIMEYFSNSGLKHVLCTDISKDGTFLGPNITLYKEISNMFQNIDFQASGGVGSLKDIIDLKKTNVKSVIIGRSFLEKKFTVKEAIECWQNE